MKKQNPHSEKENADRQHLENKILQRDRHLTCEDGNLAHNLIAESEDILNEVDMFNDPELSREMRRTICRIALA